ncbi:MAG: chromate resistance protein ChrB domain-containing protein [Nitrospirota bacterium]
MAKAQSASEIRWLVFFYTIPSKPVRNRVTIWRRLLKAGALLFKGSVYILPDTEDNYEFLSWLMSEVASLKGDAAFLRTDKIEAFDNLQIIKLFNENRGIEYRRILEDIEEIERKMAGIRIGGASQNKKDIPKQIRKCQKSFEDIKKTDFFASERGHQIEKRLEEILTGLNSITGTAIKNHAARLSPAHIEEYQGKTWVTRKKPFVDRFASAWLVKKFIDKKPSFAFIDEQDLQAMAQDVVAFDIRGGRFTHSGDLCTFEVLIKSFGLKNKALRKMAEIVHELDMKDDKFRTPEAKGIEDILSGIRRTTEDDHESLEKGMAIFEMLYVSKHK